MNAGNFQIPGENVPPVSPTPDAPPAAPAAPSSVTAAAQPAAPAAAGLTPDAVIAALRSAGMPFDEAALRASLAPPEPPVQFVPVCPRHQVALAEADGRFTCPTCGRQWDAEAVKAARQVQTEARV